jgi:HEAT repeat protein
LSEEAPEEPFSDEEIADPVEHTRVMLNALQSHDIFVRAMGVNQLGITGREHPDIAIPKLIEALSLHVDFWTVRFGAAEALGLTVNQKVIDPLIPFLKDEDADFRGKIAETLYILSDPASENHLSGEQMKNAVNPLVEALKDENPEVRSNASRALGYIGDQKAVNPLEQLAEDTSADVRKEVAEALGRLKSKTSVNPLTSMLDDEFAKVRQATVHALGEIASAEAVLPLIKTSLRDDERGPRDEAAWALKTIGNDTLLEEIRGISDDEKDHAQLLSEIIVFIDDMELKEEYTKLREKQLPSYSNSLAAIIASIDTIQSFVDSTFRKMADITDLEAWESVRQSSRSHNMTMAQISFKKFMDYDWIKGELFEELNLARRKLRTAQKAIVELNDTLAEREFLIKAGEIKQPEEEEGKDEYEKGKEEEP